MKIYLCLMGFFMLMTESPASADAEDQARRMFNRIAGIPPTPGQLTTMTQLIKDGDVEEAAAIALGEETFLSVTLKNMISRWTNVDESLNVPLNDFTATVIGMVRDEVPFDQVLYGNFLYTGGADLTAYSTADNLHYEEFGTSGQSYSNLASNPQSALNGFSESAGVITSRGFGEAYFSAGTNRRATAFLTKIFLCKDLEQLNDVTRSDSYVRRDVDRAPGGDPLVYKNQCAGCHSGMDPLTKAFSYYDFVDGEMTHTPGVIPDKINRNGNVFPEGFVTEDDNWLNLWNVGQNASLGWNEDNETSIDAGTGATSLGRMIAKTDAFGSCMAERVFTKVCLRPPLESEKESIVENGNAFRANNYNMKDLFGLTASQCLGE